MKKQTYKNRTLLLQKVQEMNYPDEIEYFTMNKIDDLPSWYAVVVILPGLAEEEYSFSVGNGNTEFEAEDDAFENAKIMING